MNWGIADWAYFVAFVILNLGLWVFIIWFLLQQGKKSDDEPQPPTLQVLKGQDTTQRKVMSPTHKNNVPRHKIDCERCNGYYVERWKGQSIFVGCSNFPKNGCRSTLSIREFIKKIIAKYDVNIYSWDMDCEYCGKSTRVHSYYLLHDLAEFIPFFKQYGDEIGVGDIPALDVLLAKEFLTIRKNRRGYFSNICCHCGEGQKYNQVVTDPHGDIWEPLMSYESLEQFRSKTLEINEPYILNAVVDSIMKKSGIDKI
ncbi:MAG: hypothetical protein HFF06_04230 [Oscillospiraceae bacterium]|nr:hypothetical protein [Oscillospiraceae bacterium]